MKKQRLFFNALLLLFSFFVCGCISYDERARVAVQTLRNGDSTFAREWSEELAENSSLSHALGCLERARVASLEKDFETAKKWYYQAIDLAIDRKEAEPKIKLSEVALGALASTITDDRTMKYSLSPYELNLALEHAILSLEQSGKRADSIVDCRLATYVQDTLPITYGADINEAKNISDSTAQTIYNQQSASLEELFRSTRNSWENPILWWLTGLIFEADGEKDMAKQSYLKAAAIREDCEVFSRDAAREIKKEKGATLAIVIGEDFVAPRVALKVPIPIYTSMSFDMPMYDENSVYLPSRISITLNNNKEEFASPALDIQALATRDLHEKMPGIIARNISRAAVAVGSQVAVNNSGNEYAQLAVLMANIAATIMRQADLRAWQTIAAGEQVYVARGLNPGLYRIKISAPNHKTILREIQIEAGETYILNDTIMKVI